MLTAFSLSVDHCGFSFEEIVARPLPAPASWHDSEESSRWREKMRPSHPTEMHTWPNAAQDVKHFLAESCFGVSAHAKY